MKTTEELKALLYKNETVGIAPEMARRRLDAQTPIETLRAAATHEVVNDGTAEQLAEKMHAVLQQL